jgi:phosphatidylglycerol lysyltransferase
MQTVIVPEGTEYYRSVAEMPEELAALLERYACKYGETYDSYLATDPRRETFWCRDRRGAVSFVRWRGRYVQVLGGLLAAPEDHDALLEDCVRLARENRWHLTFANICRDNLPLFRRHNFQISKCGEEPVVNLDKTTWRGKEYEWVRRQENYCRRLGVELLEVDPNPDDPHYRKQIAPELDEVSRKYIAATLHGRELQHYVGRFEPLQLRSNRLFVARRDGRIEAFLVCNPCLGGTMWAVETYRHRPDAVRGVVPFAILQTMRLMQAEGVPYCSLSLVPFLRCETPLTGDSGLFRTIVAFWWRRLNWIFDLQGIYHFKSRFRPEYREMYVAALPKVTVRSAFAIGRSWGIISFSPWRLLWRGLGKWKKRDSRKSLAQPDWRPGRVLRKLVGRRTPATGQDSRPALPEDEASPREAAKSMSRHDEETPLV